MSILGPRYLVIAQLGLWDLEHTSHLTRVFIDTQHHL